MKLFILTLVAILGMTTITSAQKPTTLRLNHGQQKTVGKTGLTVKFVSLVEDSRCPVGTNCVWAGNAQIQVKVSDRRGSKLIVMNTTVGATGGQYGGYAITLTSLTPQQSITSKYSSSAYTATFSIAKLHR